MTFFFGVLDFLLIFAPQNLSIPLLMSFLALQNLKLMSEIGCKYKDSFDTRYHKNYILT